MRPMGSGVPGQRPTPHPPAPTRSVTSDPGAATRLYLSPLEPLTSEDAHAARCPDTKGMECNVAWACRSLPRRFQSRSDPTPGLTPLKAVDDRSGQSSRDIARPVGGVAAVGVSIAA